MPKGRMKELLIGVIGAGNRGGLALHAHKPADGVRVAAVSDNRPEMMEQRCGLEVFEIVRGQVELRAQ